MHAWRFRLCCWPGDRLWDGRATWRDQFTFVRDAGHDYRLDASLDRCRRQPGRTHSPAGGRSGQPDDGTGLLLPADTGRPHRGWRSRRGRAQAPMSTTTTSIAFTRETRLLPAASSSTPSSSTTRPRSTTTTPTSTPVQRPMMSRPMFQAPTRRASAAELERARLRHHRRPVGQPRLWPVHSAGRRLEGSAHLAGHAHPCPRRRRRQRPSVATGPGRFAE